MKYNMPTILPHTAMSLAFGGRQAQFHIDIIYGLAFSAAFGYLLFVSMDHRVAAFAGGLVLGYFLRVWENMSVYERILQEAVAEEVAEQVPGEAEEQVAKEAEQRVAEEVEEQVHVDAEEQIAREVQEQVSAEVEDQVHDEVESRVDDEFDEQIDQRIEEHLEDDKGT